MNEAQLIKQLKPLANWQQLAFATAIAERSLPNYQLFSELAQFGDISVLKQAVGLLWEHIAGQKNTAALEKWLAKAEEIVPDLDQYDMYGASPALDSAVSVISCLMFALEPNLEDAVHVADLSLVTILKFIKHTEVADLSGIELRQYVESHPLYLAQISFLEELHQQLSTKKSISSAEIKKLRKFAQNDQISHLGITANEPNA
ncbi:YjaG family protein [Endozoicomonas sp. SM1973]|uniref:YjaG family protein n=1 Tax=Spartinivicinus marinus TaxID=2994442 RepID=A0A853I8B0_9GAMM|nr:DUF416 family protein [Spartinivicinus marinus]MCX4025804.1 DUF416 family protein [Spartinivicinus marinus]NYZ65797.1 YjaG family protein [Spartinivicinus marinus]